MYAFACIVYVSLLLLMSIDAQESKSGTAKKCIKVTSIITSFGDGSTDLSCMGCDPALPDCAIGCQNLIDSMYINCDGVCMPDGYYYDPLSTITGCWEEVKPLLKIGVERCGCNAALPKATFTTTIVFSALFLCAWILA